MSTGITSLAAARISASLALVAALMCGPAAYADPGQDEQFLTLLRDEQIPPIDNIPALINRAHEICGEFDGGTSFDSIMNEEMTAAFDDNPVLRLFPGRMTRTAAKFITASVDVYCPRHRAQLPQ